MNKLFFWVCAVLMTACASYKNDEVLTESGLSNSRFQTEINGEKTDLFVLKNKNKMEVCITNYVWGIERSGFFNGREKWAKGFENQRV